MDPLSHASSLQKTSPHSDPAVMSQMSAELTAQAHQIAANQHQLARLTHLTEELVKAIQGLQLVSPGAAASSTAAPAPPIPAPLPQSSTSPRLAFPEKFDGNNTRCKGFLLQCSLFINQQPQLYPTDISKISFVCSLLTGVTFPTFTQFLQQFQDVFEHPAGGKGAGEQLLTLSQGHSTAADYALTFRTLAAQTNWVDDTLKLLYRKGLNLELQSELACRDEGCSLRDFIKLSIQVDNVIRSRRVPRTVPLTPSAPVNTAEPMQLGFMRLTTEERDRRRQHPLCMYCGESGHLKFSCPSRPADSKFRSVSEATHSFESKSCMEIPVILSGSSNTITTSALLDSGAAGNFMSLQFAQSHNLTLKPCVSDLAEEALHGRPVGEGKILHIT